jgi:hypothetical protein
MTTPKKTTRIVMGTALTPMRMAAFAGVGTLMWWGILAALFAIFGCATAPTPRGIAIDLDRQLVSLEKWPLSVRCQAVTDAQRRCLAAGFAADCAWTNDVDADQDSFSIVACSRRAP